MHSSFGYNQRSMNRFFHKGNPLTREEWEQLLKIVIGVSNATVARRFIQTTGPLGAGVQTVANETLVGITEGYKNILGDEGVRVVPGKKSSEIVPIISKDFVLHWRDLDEARQTGQPLSFAKAAAAAASCARTEDKLVFSGHSIFGYEGLMTVEGRNTLTGLHWGNAGDAFNNFTKTTRILMARGYNGPFAAVVHPHIYADMHRVLEGSSLLEISHVKALLAAGIYRSSLLAPRTGLVVSTGKENLELIVSVDASVAFLGAKQMNLPFRVFKAVYLRILRSDAICTF
jgi:uncharacterized linocin/CFP29 family protein